MNGRPNGTTVAQIERNKKYYPHGMLSSTLLPSFLSILVTFSRRPSQHTSPLNPLVHNTREYLLLGQRFAPNRLASYSAHQMRALMTRISEATISSDNSFRLAL
jgi:hypothetical protein